ncbi:hypothetical protein DXA05_12305 [Bacteroides sp. AM54-2NS]|nr:hypothetical protein DXA05_12305 [Bacteroides sp. AM54-2NS]
MFIRRKTFKNAANSRAKSSWFIYTYEFFGVKNIKRMDKKSYYSIFLVFLNISVRDIFKYIYSWASLNFLFKSTFRHFRSTVSVIPYLKGDRMVFTVVSTISAALSERRFFQPSRY